uniref:ST3 beta-galactoside alpha-2,3-sialyltransferase 3 n=1 Tax=Pavo cristatus TaxID=9049 RepID=A0A8C9F7Z9_PAVCR
HSLPSLSMSQLIKVVFSHSVNVCVSSQREDVGRSFFCPLVFFRFLSSHENSDNLSCYKSHLFPLCFLHSLSCRRCIIVGNGGVLANKSLGLKIDDYDVVVRLNSAPVKGFEKDVGGKTTLRITYPEGAIQKMEQYEKDSLFVLAGFKWQDFKWLKYISASDGFWKSVATRVPREPHEIRILNPYFIQEAAFSFIGLPFNNGLMGRGNIPTLGSVAITMALHNCDEVAVAGFGYDMSSPNAPLHYYENIKIVAWKIFYKCYLR